MLVAVACLLPLSLHAEAPLSVSPNGLQFRDMAEGSGTPVGPGDTVTIHLVMWIDEQGQKGREVYNSRADREAVTFVVGAATMMPALNEGVRGMQAGGKRMLLVPPAFAFGSRGVGDAIAPDTSLFILVDLIEADASP
jgi:FKBP-type peptidyl-prolyl cis-trans isomerase